MAITTCLKLQINDEPPVIRSIINKNFTDRPYVTEGVQNIDDISIFAFLSEFFIGNSNWMSLRNDVIDVNTSEEDAIVGVVLDNTVLINHPSDSISLTCFTEKTIKHAFTMLMPPSFTSGIGAWNRLVQSTPYTELLQLVLSWDANFPFILKDEETTLRILRCSESDLDLITATLSTTEDFTYEIVDLFDRAQAVLTNIAPVLGEDFAPAEYILEGDYINFRANMALRPAPIISALPSSFNFNTTKYKAPSSLPQARLMSFAAEPDEVLTELPLTLILKGVNSSPWQLRKNGLVFLNDVNVVSYDRRIVNIDPELGIIIKLTGEEEFANYEFIGKADKAILTHDITIGSEVANLPLGKVEILTFSAEIPSNELTLPNIELIVPEKLPEIINTATRMFANCNLFNNDIGNWNTSNITNMDEMFIRCKSFDQSLNEWDVSKVTSSKEMFLECENFNKPLPNWNTSNITNMDGMFEEVTAFDQDVSMWDVSKVTSMDRMFYRCLDFNQDIGSWDVSSVTSMYQMFAGCALFNQDIGLWNVSNVTNMAGMFAGTKFNHNINNWNVSNVTNMEGMFSGSDTTFNQPLNNWNTSNVRYMSRMFQNNAAFNQPLNNWNTSNVIDISNMFNGATAFNGDISTWDTSKVTTLNYTFANTDSFNIDISPWNVSKVVNFTDVFKSAKIFNRSLHQWCALDESVSDIGKGVRNWSLPKPSYNYCPRKENTEFPIPFPPPVELVADYFEYTTLNTRDYHDIELSVKITVLNVEGNWSLRYGEIEVLNQDTATSRDFNTATKTLTIYPKYDDNYNHKTYRLYIKGSRLTISDAGSTHFPTEYGTLEVHKFSNTVNEYRFSIEKVKLTVPEELPTHITNTSNMFTGCNRFNQNLNNWDVSRVIKLDNMFNGCVQFNSPLDTWVINESVTSLDGMFRECNVFNQNLNNWKVSNITSMRHLFNNCTMFNSPLDTWDVAKVTDMVSTFESCTNYNQDLSSWCVPTIILSPSSFASYTPKWSLPKPIWGSCAGVIPEPELPPTQNYNIRLSKSAGTGTLTAKLNITSYTGAWEIRDVDTDTILVDNKMADGSHGDIYFTTDPGGTRFNYPNRIDVTFTITDAITRNYEIKVIAVSCKTTTSFSSGIEATYGKLEVRSFPETINELYFVTPSNVDLIVPLELPPQITSTKSMFEGNTIFDQDLSSWDVSNVTDMSNMFKNTAFNSSIDNWNVSNVTNMSGMFKSTPFNSPLNSWNVSNVTDMSDMFNNTPFNLPLNNWNVSNVTDMSGLFNLAINFNQDITGWDVSNVTNMSFMFAQAFKFNQDISVWNVGNVDNMDKMLHMGSSSGLPRPELEIFAHDLRYWCVGRVIDEPYHFGASKAILPLWGSCPNFETPRMETPESLPIIQEPYIDSTSLNFTTTNESPSNSGPLSITYYVPSTITGWILENDYVKISSTDENAGNFAYLTDRGNNVTSLSIVTDSPLHSGDRVNNYKLTVFNADSIRLVLYRNGSSRQYYGKIDITAFSNLISRYEFDLPGLIFTLPTSLPSHITNTSKMFSQCDHLNFNIDAWDTSNVTDMSYMFKDCTDFNQPIGNWNVSNVTNMTGMFKGARNFNQNINTWDVSNVTSFKELFYEASMFDAPLDRWVLTSTTSLAYMFDNAAAFNQPINNWSVGHITNMEYMFRKCTYTQELNNWDVSKVTNMNSMFHFSNFNSPLDAWDTSNVTTMVSLFDSNNKFNQNLYDWNISKVTNMNYMFKNAYNFNQDLGQWCVPHLSKPTEFDVNTRSWTPYTSKPDWGTCPPSLSLSEISTGLIGNTFNFNTMNLISENEELQVSVLLHSPVGAWAIRDYSGKVLANSNGYYARDVLITLGESLVTVTLSSRLSNTRNCSVDCNADKIVLSFDSKKQRITEGNVNVSSFSDHVSKYEFSLINSLLTVPTLLPNHITSTANMFRNTPLFNDDISLWNMGNVTDVSYMLANTKFNYDISPWNMSNVTKMDGLFSGAAEFNQDISGWNISKVTSFSALFNGATAFNQNISVWDTVNITNIDYMFNHTSFNQDISGWNVSNVTSMEGTFSNTTKFDQDISGWDTSKVTNMQKMFEYSAMFNQDIGSWKVSNVADMTYMFYNATAFNQNLGGWCVPNIPTKPSNFDSLTDKWLELKPIWGTCPVVAEPTQALRFTTTNLKSDNDELLIEIRLPVTANIWTLRDAVTREILAVDNRYITPGINIRRPRDMNIITLQRKETDVNIREYILEGDIDSIEIIHTSSYSERMSPDGSFVVHSLSETINHFKFKVENVNLVMPLELPPQVTSLKNAFAGSTLFNQDISSWNTVNVTDMSGAFLDCVVFDSPLGSWNVSNVINMSNMFSSCISFNQSLNTWNTGKVTDISEMFKNCIKFNGDITNWDVSNVTDMRYMFGSASNFNQDLSSWDVSSVTNMNGMFNGASVFNQDISGWNTRNVTDMSFMFSDASVFNQNIGGWDTSSTNAWRGMFRNCTAFNQDLSQWCVPSASYYFYDGYADNTPSWSLPKPSWGTCPRGENLLDQN